RTRLQVLFVGQPRFAEMHLGVDHSRQDVQAVAVDRLAGACPRQIAERRDAAARYGEITRDRAILVDDGTAFEEKIERLCHIDCSCGGRSSALRSHARYGKSNGMAGKWST